MRSSSLSSAVDSMTAVDRLGLAALEGPRWQETQPSRRSRMTPLLFTTWSPDQSKSNEAASGGLIPIRPQYIACRDRDGGLQGLWLDFLEVQSADRGIAESGDRFGAVGFADVRKVFLFIKRQVDGFRPG